MSGLVFLMLAVVLSLVGSLVIWLVSRKPTRWDSGIEEFSRNMDALAPDKRDEPRRRRRGRAASGGR